MIKDISIHSAKAEGVKKKRFSVFVINALVEVITGGAAHDSKPSIGVYRSGPNLERFFMGCGLDMRIDGQSRVPATTEFLRALQDKNDEDSIERIITHVSDSRHYIDEPAKGLAVIECLNSVLQADGYEVCVVNHKAVLTASKGGNATVSAIVSKSELLNFDTVERDVERALQSVQQDPEDAVTAACSLVESVCRSILIELHLPLPPKKDIDSLVRAVQEPLELSPGRTDLPLEIESDVRQILGGLTTIAKGVGSLRTHAGDAHGRERGFRRIDERIARLAIHTASTFSLFMIETWERKYQRTLPLRADEAEKMA